MTHGCRRTAFIVILGACVICVKVLKDALIAIRASVYVLIKVTRICHLYHVLCTLDLDNYCSLNPRLRRMIGVFYYDTGVSRACDFLGVLEVETKRI